MLENAKFTDFTVSELLRNKNQTKEGERGSKISSYSPLTLIQIRDKH